MPSDAQHPLAPRPERRGDDTEVPDLAMYSRSRMARDLYERSLAGPFFYIIGSLVCAAVGGYFQPLRTVAWLPTFGYALLFVLRRLNRPGSGVSSEDLFLEWRRRHLALNYGTCLGWAVLVMGVVAIERAPTLTVTVAVICTVMYGSAISQAFAMDRAGTTTTLAILLVPMILTGIVFAPFRALAVTLVFYFAYSVWNLRRLATEYETQMTTEHALVLSRAEVERLSRVDALTTLANRRAYESAYPRAWRHASRARTDLALLLLDIDHFKRVNDTYGHLAGDACLQHFAGLMKNRFRRNVDLLARIGGEELVVVLPGCTPQDALLMAEAFREDVEQSPCTTGVNEVRMTVSIGVGSPDWNVDVGPEGTFARVDVACYEAKTSGRNRVVVAKGKVEAPMPSASQPATA